MPSTLFQEQVAFLQDVPKLLNFLWKAGFQITGGELLRTPEQQQIYVQTGKSKTLVSNHLVKCAIDLNCFKSGRLATFAELEPTGKFWESLNPKNRWGGYFKSLVDTPHFERNIS